MLAGDHEYDGSDESSDSWKVLDSPPPVDRTESELIKFLDFEFGSVGKDLNVDLLTSTVF